MEYNEWKIVKEAKNDIAADVIDLATREAQSKVQLTVSEITEKQFLSPLVKEILRSHMPSASYLKNVEMNIAEMLQKILEIGRGDLLFSQR